jgi:hypothetical protein
MKAKLCILIALFSIQTNFSQTDENDVGKFLEFTSSIVLYEVTKKVSSSLKLIPLTELSISPDNSLVQANDDYVINGTKSKIYKKQLFKITDLFGEIYIISIVGNDAYKDKLYALTESQKKFYTTKYKGESPLISFVSTAMIIPIKIRFGDGSKTAEVLDENGKRTRFSNFEGNFNVGGTAGARLRLHPSGHSFMNLVGGLSLGTTPVTSTTADVESEINATTLSPFMGLLFEYDSFQVGVFYGWDQLGGSVGRTWVYQGKPWLGVGLGYKVFSNKKNDENN